MALVTFESVANAAESLLAAGQSVSVRAVTAVLGGGSPNTITKLVKDWREGKPVARLADAALDGKITTAILDQMQKFASAATAAADERFAVATDDLQLMTDAYTGAEKQIAELTLDRDATQQQVVALEVQLKEAAAEAHRVAEKNINLAASLRQDAAAERQRLEVATTELARAEVRLEALPGLHAEVAQLRTALDAAQQARVVAEQAAAVAIARLDERSVKASAKAAGKAPSKMPD